MPGYGIIGWLWEWIEGAASPVITEAVPYGMGRTAASLVAIHAAASLLGMQTAGSLVADHAGSALQPGEYTAVVI